MSNDTQRADQIVYHFYTKLVLAVSNARLSQETNGQAKIDKWFNLEIPESSLFKDNIRLYRSVSTAQSTPPFELQVLLSVPDLSNNQVLVYVPPGSSRVRVDPPPKFILLETWVVNFVHGGPQYAGDVAPSTIYKLGIALFRSVYALLRILPTWKSHSPLRRRVGGSAGAFTLQLRLRSEGPDDRILAFDTPPNANSPPLATDTHEFPPIPHPMGTLSLTATYLTQPHFRLDDLESLLSSRFLSLDEGPEFTPTLTKKQQRELSTSPPASLPLRTALPRSPPSTIADRFVLPSTNNARTNFPSTGTAGALSISPSKGGLVQSPSLRPRTLSGIDSGAASGVSETSSSRRSIGSARDDPQLASRLRRESLSSSPGSPSPLSARRPNIFKSSTLSNAASPSLPSQPSSLRHNSPLSGPSLPSRTLPQLQSVPLPTTRTLSSPVSAISRQSPPFQPSSLGKAEERRSLDIGVGGILNPPTTRKRYSSSFGHRYAASTGAGSDGSPNSGPERKEIERPSSASYMSNNTDDDDISAFVQDIDARKPLRRALSDRRRYPLGTNPEQADDLRSLPHQDGNPASRPSTASINGIGEPLLTTVSDIDQRLKEMEDAFAARLADLSDTAPCPRTGGGVVRGLNSNDRSSSRERALTMRGAVLPESYDPLSRHRRSSMGSVRSGLSIGSEEVIGKLELEDKRKSKGV
ncbi:autophagy-related protein 13-domain-containing protein [Thelephora terrestris]|uniref:Autophagy-related protein 13 n=1 Tax=Thelephora terrestris TaxID=56493 RepID=A0A9P6HLA2_9AGAM|nr:autophagy-related protein 13-domain-containing protein [Thelephora terrestris]